MQAEHGLRQAHAELEQRVQERTAALTRSNASLRENEARFRLVLQDSPITVFTQDRNLRYTWIYNAAPQFTHTHVLGKTDVEILPPDDATRFIELKQRVLDTGTGARQDVSVTIGGSQRWYHLKLEPLRASDSRVQGITGVATDITPYRRASEAQRLLAEVSSQLAASLDTVERLRQFVRLMTEELADLCIIHILAQSESTDNLMLFHTDPTSEEHIRAGIQGRAMYSEQHPLVAHVLHSGRLIHLRDIPERHQVSDAEADYLAQLRAWGALSYVGVPMVARNTVIGVLTLVRDRGERRYTLEDLPLIEELARRAALALDNIYLYEAEQRARRAAEQAADRTARLQRITAALVEGQSFDEIARVVVEQAVAALGARAGMIVLLNEEGSHIEVIRTQGYGTGWQEQWQRFPIGDIPTPITTALEQGAPVWLPSRAEFARRYPEFSQQADERSQAWAALPLLVEGHAVGGLGLSFASEQSFPSDDQAFILLLVQQCTQALERARLYEAEHRAREEAEEAVRIRDQVFRLISHDLKAPLSAIQGYAYLLQRRFAALDISEAERFTRGLSNIESTTRRMAVQIEELLDVAALQAGRGISLAFGPFDLTSLVQQVIDESQQISDDHEVVLDVPREHFELIGDEVRLQRVLTNLVTNAIKYSPQGGEVHVMIERQEVESIPGVAVAVHDQGIGIPADELPTIFEPFTRGSNTSQEISGTGLGLASAQQIVEQHGGRIIAQSQEGQGSTFTIWLPLEHTE
jgi:PAS domain S-box-containing protein